MPRQPEFLSPFHFNLLFAVFLYGTHPMISCSLLGVLYVNNDNTRLVDNRMKWLEYFALSAPWWRITFLNVRGAFLMHRKPVVSCSWYGISPGSLTGRWYCIKYQTSDSQIQNHTLDYEHNFSLDSCISIAGWIINHFTSHSRKPC